MSFEKPVYDDPFRPKLLGSPSFQCTEEQAFNIREVLDYSCSDSRFSQKAFAAIMNILADKYWDYTPPEPPAEGMRTPTAPARPPEDKIRESNERHERERREEEQHRKEVAELREK
jgi:hypothetical protein